MYPLLYVIKCTCLTIIECCFLIQLDGNNYLMDDSLKNKIATNHNKELNSIHTFQNIQVSTTGETILTIINICTNWS